MNTDDYIRILRIVRAHSKRRSLSLDRGIPVKYTRQWWRAPLTGIQFGSKKQRWINGLYWLFIVCMFFALVPASIYKILYGPLPQWALPWVLGVLLFGELLFFVSISLQIYVDRQKILSPFSSLIQLTLQALPLEHRLISKLVVFGVSDLEIAALRLEIESKQTVARLKLIGGGKLKGYWIGIGALAYNIFDKQSYLLSMASSVVVGLSVVSLVVSATAKRTTYYVDMIGLAIKLKKSQQGKTR